MSGISQDVRDLEASDDPRAAGALSYFAWRVRREIGALAAFLATEAAAPMSGSVVYADNGFHTTA